MIWCQPASPFYGKVTQCRKEDYPTEGCLKLPRIEIGMTQLMFIECSLLESIHNDATTSLNCNLRQRLTVERESSLSRESTVDERSRRLPAELELDRVRVLEVREERRRAPSSSSSLMGL